MKKNKILIFTLGLLSLVAIVFACKTPVYKYAILNWADREYYQILRVYDSSKKQAETDPEIKKQFEGKEFITNVGIIPIDISQDLKQMYGDDFPTFLKEHMGENQPPYNIILNPRKNVIYKGDIKPDDIPKLIMSPKRKELAEKLSIGYIMLVLVEGKDEAKNKKAHEEIKKGIAKSIEVELDIRSHGEDPSAPPIDKKTLKPITMSYVAVSPNDANEVWFYRQMQKINPRITDEKEPALYGIVGRGFVFDQGLVGEYLTEEQIVNMTIFLSGPCSCTVKAEAGGIDIITSWEWDKTIKVKLEANEEDPETAKPNKVDGFGGEEIEQKPKVNSKEATKEPAKEASKEAAKDKKEIKEPVKAKITGVDHSKNQAQLDQNQELPVNNSDFLKIIIFAIGGVAVLLFIITKVMKVNKE